MTWKVVQHILVLYGSPYIPLLFAVAQRQPAGYVPLFEKEGTHLHPLSRLIVPFLGFIAQDANSWTDTDESLFFFAS